jgi:phosphoribosylanthranilate isomerase
MFVKICGLRDAAAAQVAVDAGADALGFILAPSKRQVDAGDVAAIRDALHGDVPPLVGVTVNMRPMDLADLVRRSGVDIVQLSGDEAPGVVETLPVPAIKALRFRAGASVDQALREVERWLSLPLPPAYVMVDGHVDGAFGGTGVRADWRLLAGVAMRFPIILAGGLDPQNVAEAVEAVHPFGVDVASGTETGGIKDPHKIQAFVRRAKSAGQAFPREA